MKTIKIATEFSIKYASIDGKQWDNKTQCKQYEQLLADPSPLKELCFYDDDGKRIDIFALHDIPMSVYLVLTHDIPQYNAKVIKEIINNPRSDETSFNLPTKKGIWYNDWSNAYNGSFGGNGWTKCLSIDEIQHEIYMCKQKINMYQQKIEFYSKIGVDI
jgi:hypothetical protein